jgi:hypothetical protein
MSAPVGAYCPEWCTAIHTARELEEDDLVVHSRRFGSFDDGEISMVEVWVINCGSQIETSGVTVPVEDMHTADNLRLLAANCYEASKWMDENLGTELITV